MPIIQGFVPGQRYAAGSAYGQGMSFGTPRDYTNGRGGTQLYDPQYAKPLTQEPGGTRAMPTTFGSPMASVAKGGGAIKPGGGGGVVGGSRGFFGGLPWQGGGDIFAPPQDPFASITTSIVPRAPYSPEQTLAATNQAVAAHHASGNPNDIMKRFDSPGISRGGAHIARTLPIVAQANQAARRARAELPMEDFFANQQSILGGQTASEQEAQALAQLALRQQANQQQLRFGMENQRLQNFGTGLNLVDTLMGL